jgi:hypothetical protein
MLRATEMAVAVSMMRHTCEINSDGDMDGDGDGDRRGTCDDSALSKRVSHLTLALCIAWPCAE